jgi:hypothetical protein
MINHNNLTKKARHNLMKITKEVIKNGPRKLNVILTHLRCTASFLNHELYKVISYLAQLVAVVPPIRCEPLLFCLQQIF